MSESPSDLPRESVSNLRPAPFALTPHMVAAMLGEGPTPPRVDNVPVTRISPVKLADLSMPIIAERIANSDPVMSTYAAPEWDCLHADGQQWIIAIVRETLRRAVEGGIHV